MTIRSFVASVTWRSLRNPAANSSGHEKIRTISTLLLRVQPWITLISRLGVAHSEINRAVSQLARLTRGGTEYLSFSLFETFLPVEIDRPTGYVTFAERRGLETRKQPLELELAFFSCPKMQLSQRYRRQLHSRRSTRTPPRLN